MNNANPYYVIAINHIIRIPVFFTPASDETNKYWTKTRRNGV